MPAQLCWEQGGKRLRGEKNLLNFNKKHVMVALFADLFSSGHDPGEGGGKLRAPSGPGRSRGCPGVPPPLLGVPSDSPGLIPDGGGGFWRGLGQIHFSDCAKEKFLKELAKETIYECKEEREDSQCTLRCGGKYRNCLGASIFLCKN